MLDETLGFEGTDCSICSKKKEITLRQQGGKSSTVIKTKYVRKLYIGLSYVYHNQLRMYVYII